MTWLITESGGLLNLDLIDDIIVNGEVTESEGVVDLGARFQLVARKKTLTVAGQIGTVGSILLSNLTRSDCEAALGVIVSAIKKAHRIIDLSIIARHLQQMQALGNGAHLTTPVVDNEDQAEVRSFDEPAEPSDPPEPTISDDPDQAGRRGD